MAANHAFLRGTTGASLALVAALTFVMVTLGLALFMIAKLVGGTAQLEGASNAGGLNVGKETPRLVNISLSSSINPWEPSFLGLGQGANSDKINLSDYGALIGKALLVALNAAADGTLRGCRIQTV